MSKSFNPLEYGAKPVQKGSFNPLEYGAKPVNDLQQPQENPTWGNRLASGAKAIFSGIAGAIPDTASLAYNLPAMAYNARARENQNLSEDEKALYQDLAMYDPQYQQYLNTAEVPLIPSATEAIDQGIDTATGGYTNTPQDQRYINEGLKLGASVATGGGLSAVGKATGKQALSKAGNFIGSTNPLQVAGATVGGGTTSYLADNGASTAEALGGGLAANLAVNALPNVASGGKNLLTKGALNVAGLGKDKLNLEAAKAAQDLGIALPKAAASEGKIIALADQFLSKAPIAGNIIQKRYLAMGDKVLKELDKAYDSVFPANQLIEVKDRISKFYDKADELLPTDAQIVPKNLTNAVKKTKERLDTIGSLSGGEEKVLSVIKDYEKNFQIGIKTAPLPITNLRNSRKSLGKEINWKATDVNWKDETEAVKDIKALYHSFNEDLAEYGKKNPEWYNYHKEADNLYSKVKTREEVQDIFTSVENSATGELSYNSLSKVLNDENTKTRLKEITPPETYARLQKLGTVARAMAIKNKNLPNPSGTAASIATSNVIGSMAGVGSYATGAGWSLAVKYIIAAPTLAHLLTDKKTLDLAIKFAENGTQANAVNFSQSMKKITGYTPVTLLREAQKLEQNKQEDKNKMN